MKISLSVSILLLSTILSGCLAPPQRPATRAEKHKGEGNLGSGGTPTGNEGEGGGEGGSGGGEGGTGGGEGGTGGGEGGTGGGEGGTGGGESGTGGGGEGGTGGEGGGGGGGPKGPALQTSERFDELVWLTSHNAFVNDKDAGWKVVNQSRSIQYQLDNGVDAFMLDIFSFDNRRLMCHGSCDGIEDPIFKKKVRVPGVHEQMDLVPTLRLFNAHLDKHKDAFLTIIFEDYMNPGDLTRSFDEVPGLRDKIFDPYKWDVMGKGWPRLDALRKDNKRLFVISDRNDKKNLGVAYAKDFTSENYWSLGKSGDDVSCKPRWDAGKPLNRIHDKFQYLTVVNHFRDIPNFKFSQADNTQAALWKRLNENCLPAYQRKPNFLAVDHFDEADWGARKVVAELRTMGVTVYKDKNLVGPMKMMKEGRFQAKDMGIGDNELSSIKVNAGFRVKLYDDGDYKNLLIELTEDSRDLGDKAKKASSLVIEKK